MEQRLAADTTITALVNNAGVAGSGDFVGSDPDAFEKMIQLNVVAVTRLASAADWDAALAVRAKLYPNLSRNRPADRFSKA